MVSPENLFFRVTKAAFLVTISILCGWRWKIQKSWEPLFFIKTLSLQLHLCWLLDLEASSGVGHSFRNYLWSTSHVPGIVLGPKDEKIKKINGVCSGVSVYLLGVTTMKKRKKSNAVNCIQWDSYIILRLHGVYVRIYTCNPSPDEWLRVYPCQLPLSGKVMF